MTAKSHDRIGELASSLLDDLVRQCGQDDIAAAINTSDAKLHLFRAGRDAWRTGRIEAEGIDENGDDESNEREIEEIEEAWLHLAVDIAGLAVEVIPADSTQGRAEELIRLVAQASPRPLPIPVEAERASASVSKDRLDWETLGTRTHELARRLLADLRRRRPDAKQERNNGDIRQALAVLGKQPEHRGLSRLQLVEAYVATGLATALCLARIEQTKPVRIGSKYVTNDAGKVALGIVPSDLAPDDRDRWVNSRALVESRRLIIENATANAGLPPTSYPDDMPLESDFAKPAVRRADKEDEVDGGTGPIGAATETFYTAQLDDALETSDILDAAAEAAGETVAGRVIAWVRGGGDRTLDQAAVKFGVSRGAIEKSLRRLGERMGRQNTGKPGRPKRALRKQGRSK